MSKTIFVLGGYGGTGRVVCRELLKYTDVNVVVAGRNLDKTKEVVGRLAKEFSPDRIRAARADASKPDELIAALEGSCLLLVASTTPQYAKKMVEIALEAGVDYLDYHFSNDVPAEIETLRAQVIAKKRIVITQAGFHPGLPATFVRYGSKFFDTYSEAYIGMVMNTRIESSDSLYELVDELQHPSGELFERGAWRKARLSDVHLFDLGRFGKKNCVPLKMIEMHVLPRQYPLTDMGTFISGFNWFTDYFIFPTALVFGKLFPKLSRKPLTRLLTWGINTFSSDTPGVVFVLEARGDFKGKNRHIRVEADCNDAFDFTAFSVVACVRQYLDGTIGTSGIHLMGAVIDPEKLMADLKSMGVSIEEKII